MRRFVLPELAVQRRRLQGLRPRGPRTPSASTASACAFLRGIFATLGFRQAEVHFKRGARFSGGSKYPLKSVLRLARDAVTSNTVWPLRVGTFTGIGLLCLSVVVFAWSFTSHRALPFGIQTSLQLFMGGMALCMLGGIGEYLKVLVMETKQRPLYIVRELCNLAPRRAVPGAAPAQD
jgi:hypothetical protein